MSSAEKAEKGQAAEKRGKRVEDDSAPEPDFEGSLRRLEAIVARLEAGELPLEETLRLFEEGQTLVRNCGDLLERAEQRVKELVEATGERRDLAVSGTGATGATGAVGVTGPTGASGTSTVSDGGAPAASAGGTAVRGASEREGRDA